MGEIGWWWRAWWLVESIPYRVLRRLGLACRLGLHDDEWVDDVPGGWQPDGSLVAQTRCRVCGRRSTDVLMTPV